MNTTNPVRHEIRYEIRVQSHLDKTWMDGFGELQIEHQPDGCTRLIGQMMDQSALYGLLNKIHDLGLTLLSVTRFSAIDEQSSTQENR
jgi:hypothetical protein